MYDKETMRKYQKEYWQRKPLVERKTITQRGNRKRLQRARENKKRAIKIMGGACQECGYSRCTAALEFHHKDGTKKERNISQECLATWSRLVEEIKKCRLLCSNCHKELHYMCKENCL